LIRDNFGSNGVEIVDNTKITIANPGIYTLTAVLQAANEDNAVEELRFWLKFNGVNYPNSTTLVTLPPRKSATEPSAQLVTVTFTGNSINPNDYVEIYWETSNLLTHIHADSTANLAPSVPSVIVSLTQVMYTQVGPTGPTGATGDTGPTGAGLPAGGTTGQFLVKASDNDYDYEWLEVLDGGTP
jgi:hypothetical protein